MAPPGRPRSHRTMQIGRIDVENVEVVILDDKALDGTLLGMSFLSSDSTVSRSRTATLSEAVNGISR